MNIIWLMGAETLHPLVSVVDFSTLKSLKHGRKNFGFFCIFLKQLKCGELSYGQHVRLSGRHAGVCGSGTSGRG